MHVIRIETIKIVLSDSTLTAEQQGTLGNTVQGSR